MQFLTMLENSAFGAWVRESSTLWAYPTILFLHTIGLGLLVGPNAVIDLRVLGFAPRARLAPMETFYRIMWFGFWINALSGVALLIADATTKLTNPVFFIKMGFVLLAVVNMVVIRRRVFRDPYVEAGAATRTAGILAATSLVLWTGAITAGRLMAYIGPVSGAPNLSNAIGR
jgi:hypothetical protein